MSRGVLKFRKVWCVPWCIEVLGGVSGVVRWCFEVLGGVSGVVRWCFEVPEGVVLSGGVLAIG